MTFEVPHKPGYRLKMRMGIHSGSVVAGVVGTKIPHYSVFGETVEMANGDKAEASSVGATERKWNCCLPIGK